MADGDSPSSGMEPSLGCESSSSLVDRQYYALTAENGNTIIRVDNSSNGAHTSAANLNIKKGEIINNLVCVMGTSTSDSETDSNDEVVLIHNDVPISRDEINSNVARVMKKSGSETDSNDEIVTQNDEPITFEKHNFFDDIDGELDGGGEITADIKKITPSMQAIIDPAIYMDDEASNTSDLGSMAVGDDSSTPTICQENAAMIDVPSSAQPNVEENRPIQLKNSDKTSPATLVVENPTTSIAVSRVTESVLCERRTAEKGMMRMINYDSSESPTQVSKTELNDTSAPVGPASASDDLIRSEPIHTQLNTGSEPASENKTTDTIKLGTDIVSNGVGKDFYDVHFEDGHLNLVQADSSSAGDLDGYEVSVLNFDVEEPSLPFDQPLVIDCANPETNTADHLQHLTSQSGSSSGEQGPSTLSPRYNRSDEPPRPVSALSDPGPSQFVKKRQKRRSKRKVVENLGPASYFDDYINRKGQGRHHVPGYVHDHVYPLNLKFEIPPGDSTGDYPLTNSCSRCAPRRFGVMRQSDSECECGVDDNVNGIVQTPTYEDAISYFLRKENGFPTLDEIAQSPARTIEIPASEMEHYTCLEVFESTTDSETSELKYENVKTVYVGSPSLASPVKKDTVKTPSAAQTCHSSGVDNRNDTALPSTLPETVHPVDVKTIDDNQKSIASASIGGEPDAKIESSNPNIMGGLVRRMFQRTPSPGDVSADPALPRKRRVIRVVSSPRKQVQTLISRGQAPGQGKVEGLTLQQARVVATLAGRAVRFRVLKRDDAGNVALVVPVHDDVKLSEPEKQSINNEAKSPVRVFSLTSKERPSTQLTSALNKPGQFQPMNDSPLMQLLTANRMTIPTTSNPNWEAKVFPHVANLPGTSSEPDMTSTKSPDLLSSPPRPLRLFSAPTLFTHTDVTFTSTTEPSTSLPGTSMIEREIPCLTPITSSAPNDASPTLETTSDEAMTSFVPAMPPLLLETTPPRTIDVRCDDDEMINEVENESKVLKLPDGGLLMPIERYADSLDEKDQLVLHLRRKLALVMEEANRHENYLQYERWAHEETKRQLVEQRVLVKWFQNQVEELAEKANTKRRERKKKAESQYKTRRPVEQDDEIELGEFVPSTQLDHDYSKVVDGVPCFFCDKTFNTANQMMTHRSHTHRGWRRCNGCKTPFETTGEYEVHIANGCTAAAQNPSVAKTYEINCSICRQSFGNSMQIRRHQEQVHGLVVKIRWACPVCKSQFINLKKLKAHCNKAHKNQKAHWLRKLTAKICRRVTKTMDTQSTFVKPKEAPSEPPLTVTPQTSPVKDLRRGQASSDVPTSPGKQILDIVQSSLAMDEEMGASNVLCRYCNNEKQSGITVGSNICRMNMAVDWKCHVCGVQLKNKQGHIVHFRSHFRLVIICHICQESCPSKLHFYEHHRTKHSGHTLDAIIVEPKKPSKPKVEAVATKIASPKSKTETKVTCLCCRQSFPTDVSLNDHYARYAKRKFHQCRFCSERLGSASDLESHEEGHKNAFNPYKCHICAKKLRTMPMLLAHRKEKHSDWEIVDFYMPEISQRLAMKHFDDESVEGSVDTTDENQSDWMGKARKSLCPEAKTKVGVEKETEVKEECHYCWESFPDKQALSAHLPIHRLENEPFRCPECMQTFAWKNDRHRHRFLYHGVPMPENHPCAVAAAKAKKAKQTSEATLDNDAMEEERENRGSFQVLKQLGEKSWQCCTCNKKYKNQVSGNVHATKCRKNAQTRMHRRKSVLRSKQQQQSLLVGGAIETSETDSIVKQEEIKEEEDEDNRIVKNLLNRDLTNLKTRFEVKPIQCACCLRVFKNNFSLSRHINYMVAHWCKVCGGLYKKLALHQESKHGYQYKAIMCLQCGSVFETQTGLNEHIIDEHAKSRDVDSVQLKTVDEIKQEVVEETRIFKHVVQCEEDSKSSAGDTPASDSEKIGRSLHDVLDANETHKYFSKKVVHGSNFLLSKSDPDSRLMERAVARNSFKNQSRKRKQPKPKAGKDVVGRRSGRKTASAAGSTEISDEEEGTIDSLSDDESTVSDQSTVVAAIQAQYSQAVSLYEKKDKAKEKNANKERAGIFEAMDKGKPRKTPPSTEKRDKRLLRGDVPNKVKPSFKFDDNLFDSESEEIETKPRKKSKKDKHRPKPDLIRIESDGSSTKKFKIPRKSPMKRSSSFDEEIPSKKSKSSHGKDDGPRMDKLKSKIDPKTLSIWKSIGSGTPQEEPAKKQPVAKKSLKSPPPVSQPSTITLTLNESGQLVSEGKLDQSKSDSSQPKPMKAKARKTIHGVRPQPSENKDEQKRSTSYSESRKDFERLYNRQASLDKDSKNDDSSVGSRTPSEGGRTPNDPWALDTVPKKESPKARKSSHGTQERRRDERRRPEEPDRYDDRWRSRDDRSSTSSERRFERSDSRGSDRPHSSRDDPRPPPAPHRAILIDAVPDTRPDREEERRRSIEVLKRQFERRPLETCKICSENFSNKTLLFRHVNDVHRSGPRRSDDRPPRFEYDPSSEPNKERDFRRFDTESLKCMYCPATFPDRVSRSQHVTREHSGMGPRLDERRPPPVEDRPVQDTPQFPCTECWKQFVSQRGLELHMINKHGAEPGEDMSYRSSNPYDYKPPPNSEVERRPRARMGSSFVRPRCEVCGRTFPDRVALTIHMRGHNARPETPDPRMIQGPPEPGAVTCKICLNHFHSFTALRQHHAQVHDERDDVDFECRLCGKVFPSFGALNAHKAVHRSRMM